MKKMISALIIGLSFASLAQAAPQFQAGNILKANPDYKIDDTTGIASYYLEYADGIKGDLEFICILHGKDASAKVYGGKNLWLNEPYNLTHGKNGPFVYHFLNTPKNSTGNVKIEYRSGTNVFVNCIGRIK